MRMDKKIQKALEGAGFEWTGQGTDLKSGVRDIGFEYELPVIEEGKKYRLVRNA